LSVVRLGDAVPRRGNRLTRGLARWALAALGWRLDMPLPNAPKFVIVVAPHTSAWDFFIGLFVAIALGMRASWLGKHGLFRWPLGGLMRWMGGIPVKREASHGVVDTMVELFRERSALVLALAPEGTRSKVREWKTGFYHIAHGAGVPIVPCYLDYARKVIGSGAAMQPTGDVAREVAALQAFYSGIPGKHPKPVDPCR